MTHPNHKAQNNNNEAHTTTIRTVLVPVSRPDTARQMLDIAISLVKPVEGRVIALMISLGDTENASKMAESVEPLVNELQEKGDPVELLTEMSTSISRGVLDAARENGADLIILGVQKADRRQVKLGTVVENVVKAAPCDVMIYRLSESPNYHRVVVPVDYSQYTGVALMLAAQLALSRDAQMKLYIRRDYVFPSHNEEQIDELLADVPDDRIERAYTTGHDPANRILGEVTDNDLLILGFSQKSDFERQIEDDMANRLLNRAMGPVIMVSRLAWKNTFTDLIRRRLLRWNPTLTEVERNELTWQARKQAEPNLDYSVMIFLSAGLASLGLLLSSPAVIIGAMLVAPLMQPLLAFSSGLVTGLLTLSRRSALTLFQGVLLSLLVSALAGILLPTELPTPEMLARGNPSLLDAGVALVSGLVAAYATARKGIPAALAGVAIAAALMPPICTVGLGAAFRNADLAMGAGLLFLTNIISIIVAQAVVFLWLGMRPGQQTESVTVTRVWWGVLVSMLAGVLIILFNLSQQAVDEAQITQQFLDLFAPAEIVDVELQTTDAVEVVLTVRSTEPIPPGVVSEARNMLSDNLNQPVRLHVVVQESVRSEAGLQDRIESYLADSLPASRLLDVDVMTGETLQITARVQSAETITPAQVRLRQQELAALLEQSVRLELLVEPVIRILPEEAEVTPEATPQ